MNGQVHQHGSSKTLEKFLDVGWDGRLEKRNTLLLPGTEPRFLGFSSSSLLTVLTVTWL
jgi:hypothetical protein